MKDLFERVLDLQLEHSSLNTPAMQERGLLIRKEIPDWLRAREADLRRSFNGFSWQLAVQGKDATGPKAYVPWVRVYNPVFSPSAQLSWYIVYLFRPAGDGVGLCLSHGSTRWDGSTFKPRSDSEAAELMRWSRELLSVEAKVVGMSEGINLDPLGLGPAYEKTTAFSKMYSRNAIPAPDELIRDCEEALGLLGKVYRQVELGRAPHSPLPEEVEAARAIEEAARPTSNVAKKTGQGFGRSPQERRLVEQRAMQVAAEWLDEEGFEWRDVHKNKSFDFQASKDDESYVVEVKGTTGGLSSIILTKNEVQLHRSKHPLNILLVVHGIELTTDRKRASGEILHCVHPWEIAEANLQPMSYRYVV